MFIDFPVIGVVNEQPVLVLKNADGTPLQTLGFAYNVKADIRYNEVSTLTFDLPAYVDGEKTPHYDDVVGMRIIDLNGWGQFILMNPKRSNDGVREIKSCKAYSLEYELTYKTLYVPPLDDAPINLQEVGNMIREEVPSWDIIIPADMLGKYRTFSEENTNVYNFIKSSVQKAFSCIFDFDIYNRRMIVRSTSSTVSTEPVYISLDNLAKQIEIEEDTEHIVTVLDVHGGEDVDLLMVNPLGTNKLYNLDYFMNETNFDSELISKWNAWKQKYETARSNYYRVSIELALKTAAIMAEQARLEEMKGTELGELENRRAVYVEYLAQLPNKNSSEYYRYAELLRQVNSEIERKQYRIGQKETLIADLTSEESSLLTQLDIIKESVSFSNTDNFTAEMVETLSRYFKEDSIEEDSFVLTDVASYEGDGYSGVDDYSDGSEGISAELSPTNVSFSDCRVSLSNDTRGNRLFIVTGGEISCMLSETTRLSANVINASFDARSGSFSLSAYLGSGRIEGSNGGVSFPSGCVTITGESFSVSSDARVYSGVNMDGSYLTVSTGTNSRLYFTRDTTDYERYAVEWNLYDYGRECLNALAYPSYTFRVTTANFFALDEFRSFINTIKLGERIYLNTGDEVLEPICVGVSIDFENMANLSLLFGDKYSASDKAFHLVDLLDDSISMGKTLKSNKLSYSSFVNSGASTAVRDFMQSALDVARNRVLSSSGQGVSWDESGIHLRKYRQGSSVDFENEQIWMMNNTIAFTDDGWQTAKMAIGKIVDESIKKYVINSSSTYNPNTTYYVRRGTYGSYWYERWNGGPADWADRPMLYVVDQRDHTGYGIAAPYIVGTLLAGQNLEIATENGAFRVDGSGVWIDSLNLHITHGSHSNQTLSEAFDAISQETANLSYNVGEALAGINDRISNTSKTYYQDSPPENPNVGDLWYREADGKLRYYDNADGGGYTWKLVEDAGIQDALLAANTAQTTANSKINTYCQTNMPSQSWSPAERNDHIGDLWYHTGLGDLYRFDNVSRSNGFQGWLWLRDGEARSAYNVAVSQRTRINNLIENNGFLDVNNLNRVIDASAIQMSAASGNVLFDEKGMWLMNAANKSEATQAVWINENGILFGSGNQTSTPENDWTWSTAINHGGIVADALAGKELSGVHIYGGDIYLGTKDANGQYPFYVTSDGELYAKSGTFSGKINGEINAANLKGIITADNGTWLIGAGLSIGGSADKNSGNFYVDTDGNVTMKGNINLSGGTITWSGSNTPVQVQYSATGAGKPGDEGTDWASTFVSGTHFFASYSYDGGVTWTENAVRIVGENGAKGDKGDTGDRGPRGYTGSDATVDFEHVNTALGELFKDVNGNRVTTINGSYIYSPKIKGGTIYGTELYAGDGSGAVSAMTGTGFSVGVKQDGSFLSKIGLGYYESGRYAYPYLILGAGSGSYVADAGAVMKFGNGIWIGTSNVVSSVGDEPSASTNTTGIFIDFQNKRIKRYMRNYVSEIGYSYGDVAPESYFNGKSVFEGQVYFEY